MSDDKRPATEWTDERLAETERICAAATPGPWGVEDVGPLDGDQVVAAGGRICIADDCGVFERTENQLFAIYARTALPSAIAEIRRLQGENKRLQQRLTMLSGPLNEPGVIT